MIRQFNARNASKNLESRSIARSLILQVCVLFCRGRRCFFYFGSQKVVDKRKDDEESLTKLVDILSILLPRLSIFLWWSGVVLMCEHILEQPSYTHAGSDACVFFFIYFFITVFWRRISDVKQESRSTKTSLYSHSHVVLFSFSCGLVSNIIQYVEHELRSTKV